MYLQALVGLKPTIEGATTQRSFHSATPFQLHFSNNGIFIQIKF